MVAGKIIFVDGLVFQKNLYLRAGEELVSIMIDSFEFKSFLWRPPPWPAWWENLKDWQISRRVVKDFTC